MMEEVVPGLFSDVKFYIVGEIDDKVNIEFQMLTTWYRK